jgi:hypothetical protein
MLWRESGDHRVPTRVRLRRMTGAMRDARCDRSQWSWATIPAPISYNASREFRIAPRGAHNDDAALDRRWSMNTRTDRRVGLAGLPGALALLLLLGIAHRADAESVYKCRDARGRIAYQDHACADAQQLTQIEIAKAPPPTPLPAYGVASHARAATRNDAARMTSHRGEGEHEAASYECRAGNGEVFYRHSACPKSVKTAAVERRRGDAKQDTGSFAVSGTRLTRSEACRRMAASGSIGRSGHQRDEQVSTYDRNAGRDPCRHS